MDKSNVTPCNGGKAGKKNDVFSRQLNHPYCHEYENKTLTTSRLY